MAIYKKCNRSRLVLTSAGTTELRQRRNGPGRCRLTAHCLVSIHYFKEGSTR